MILQFAPELGKVKENITRANEIIVASEEIRKAMKDSSRPIWLLLPEMCFTGYNFKDLEHIKPYLEPHCAGPTFQWASSVAKRYNWHVTVGYPELGPRIIKGRPAGTPQTYPIDDSDPENFGRFNSTVTVAPSGEIIAHYRKRFLYYTDETWADEGDSAHPASGFFAGDLGALGTVSMGICMDMNPYRFGATSEDWHKYEFATHVVDQKSAIAVFNMAWLTRLTPTEVAELPLRPDQETFAYWIERLDPLRRQGVEKCIVVCANRCGVEGSCVYAGTSTVILFEDGLVSVYDILGKMEEKCLVVDLAKVGALRFIPISC